MNVSRKGMVEFSSFSMVNLVFECRLLMCWKNYSRLHLRRMENTSSTWRSHNLGGVSAVVMAVVSIDIMQISATMDDPGPPIATPSVCWWNSPQKIKNVVRRRNSSSSNIWSGNRLVRSWKVVSLFSRSLMTRRASVIGMLVYRDSTSKNTMISSGSMVC